MTTQLSLIGAGRVSEAAAAWLAEVGDDPVTVGRLPGRGILRQESAALDTFLANHLGRVSSTEAAITVGSAMTPPCPTMGLIA
jgi:hypothetical protein